jgi:uncharacterized protein
MKQYIVHLFSKTYAIAESQKEQSHKSIFITLSTVVIACICLVFSEYWSNKSCFYSAIHFFKLETQLYQRFGASRQLLELLWWASVIIIFYFIVPLLVIKFFYKHSLVDYGLRIRNSFTERKLYVIFFLIVLPLILICSYLPSFQGRYPFYVIRNKSELNINFLIWEMVYLFQFFAVEFFFRGFLLHGTKKSLGYFSVLLSSIPYCMIHFHKPMPEALAAIIAGIILSTLSLRNTSLWLGVAIHVCIALLMDLTSLWQKGFL